MFDAKNTKDAIVRWIADYFGKPEHEGSKAVVGISGGVDSNLAAVLCKEAIGAGNVVGVLMTDEAHDDISDARNVVEHLGISHFEINMEPVMVEFYKAVENAGLTPNEMVHSNASARMRTAFLYAICAVMNGRFCNSSNRSQGLLGCTTNGGETVGDFAPIKNLFKSEVVAIAKETELLPSHIDIIPEDGLSGKSVEEDIGFAYEHIDNLIRSGIIDEKVLIEKILRMNVCDKHKDEVVPSFPNDGY